MFRIRQVFNPISNEYDEMVINKIARIYQAAFNYAPNYFSRFSDVMRSGDDKDFQIILLVAQGLKGRVLSFSLSFYFPKYKIAYLDYLASDPARQKRGYGTALYEATRSVLHKRGCRGMVFDVRTDDPDKLQDKKMLKSCQKRLAFYERFGARPVINTLYDEIATRANDGYLNYLVFDSLDGPHLLSKLQFKGVVSKILFLKGGMDEHNEKFQQIINSAKDDPIQLRPPRYIEKHEPIDKLSHFKLDFVSSGDAHQIHHLREKGYHQKPARIKALLEGLADIPTKKHKMKKYPEKFITQVHSTKLLNFLKKSAENLKPGQLLYPNVFPIRNKNKIPSNWEQAAGYFCLDTITPVTSTCYKAAVNAVYASLTGADLILKGSPITYVACRPPGHHAEKTIFGGFCYLNNVAIAANYLSKHGKIGVIDIDYHHGNGTQEIFYDRKDVYFISIHGHPNIAFPNFSGYANERGEKKGRGYNRNFPLYPQVDDIKYCEVLMTGLRILKKFDPDYVVVSFGLDMMAGDPTGAFQVTDHGLYQIGQLFAQLKKPLLIVQEGGYSIRNLRDGVNEFFRGYMAASK